MLCEINTWGELRHNASVRALTPKEEKQMFEYVETNLRRQYIRHSNAKHSCGILWIPKKDTEELRMCIDFRPVNEKTRKVVHAPPPTAAYRNRILRYTWYAKFDIKEAYYHIRVNPADVPKTAFRCNLGTFECLRMPFGLTNAPAYFQMYIENEIGDLLGRNATVHLDDILVYASSQKELRHMVRTLETRLRNANLTINENKTIRETRKVTYCGFTYENGRCYPARQDGTIRHWPVPRNKRQLQSFLGMTNTLRDHVWKYAEIASPLYESTGLSWKWTPKQDTAFRQLKLATSRCIDTHHHDPLQAATITTDASLFGISAWLSQNKQVTGIVSRALTPAEKNYDTMDRELLANFSVLVFFSHLHVSSRSINQSLPIDLLSLHIVPKH